jgi:hypothetical protein
VILHGLQGDAQGARDLLVAPALGEQVEYLALARGQVVWPGWGRRPPGQEPAGNARAEHSAAGRDGAKRRADLVGGRALEDIAASTRRQRGEDGVVVIDHGHHEHGGARGDLRCLPRRLDAGGPGQVDVHEHHVGRGLPDGLQGLFGGADRAGHLYPGQGREQPGEAVAEDGMVIDDEDPGHAGNRASTVTPGQASRTVTVPPSSSARSRMMARP